jgi:hypothetical protein
MLRGVSAPARRCPEMNMDAPVEQFTRRLEICNWLGVSRTALPAWEVQL